MSEMKYDAATIGNHDFDAGLDGLVKQMPHATFPFVICNYDFSDTEMAGLTVPSLILTRGDIRIGIVGVGIELQGLVAKDMYGRTRYLNPISNVNRTAKYLKQEEGCHLVVCLSHLGFRYQSAKISDITLAKESSDVDIILGGHTHTFLNDPELVLNAAGRPVVINQVGWAGVRLGRIDLTFERNRLNRCVSCQNLWIH
jgi:5'-nucleotidase